MCSLGVEAQIPGFNIKKDRRSVTIPFFDYNNLIIVPVSINGEMSVNFILDTGVRSNILFSKTLGDEIGLQYTRKLNLMGADGQTVLTASVSPNNTLDVGPVVGEMQPMLVLDEDFMELEMVIGIPIMGVIGYEFFKFNPVKIDYDLKTLTFYRSSAMKWRPLGYRKTDLVIENSKPYLRASLDQIQGPDLNLKLLIDTGANHGLLLNRETTDDIKLPPKVMESELGRSLGGDLFGFIGRVNKVKIGGIKFKEVITSYPEITEFSFIIQESGRQGSIGTDLISRTKVILDYQRNRMLFKKGQDFGRPFEFDMSGVSIRMLPTDEKRFYLSEVRDGSPAYENGLRTFDEILAVNKIPIDFWELSEVNKILRSREGRVIRLDVIRRKEESEAGETVVVEQIIEATFELKRQI